jgi:enoyl-CoA hydratase
MELNSFELDIKNKIATVKINRPDKANSLDIAGWRELKYIFTKLNEEPAARVVIIRGEGKHFCAGMDLGALIQIAQSYDGNCEARKREVFSNNLQELQDAITSIADCAKPVIAAVHGACVGAGVDLISACDMSYCTDDAYFCIKEVDMGLVADMGTLQRLPRKIPQGLVNELAYTGRKMFGIEAKDAGLCNATFVQQEDLYTHTEELAKQISEKSPVVIRGTKKVLAYAQDHTIKDGLEYIKVWNAGMIYSNDLMEAMQASMEKRKPIFED